MGGFLMAWEGFAGCFVPRHGFGMTVALHRLSIGRQLTTKDYFMAKVKAGVKDMPISTKLQLARQRAADLTGNPHFPDAAPTIAALTAAATALESAFNEAQTARQIAQSKTARQAELSAALDKVSHQAGRYVESTAAGDEAMIESAGFSVRAGNRPLGGLPKPESFEVEAGPAAGTMSLRWKRIHGAMSYLVDRAVDSAELLGWDRVATPTRAKVVVNSMVSGTRYWLRVAPVGAAGQGPWSDAVMKIAP